MIKFSAVCVKNYLVTAFAAGALCCRALLQWRNRLCEREHGEAGENHCCLLGGSNRPDSAESVKSRLSVLM